MRVVFMGTPEFSVPTLQALYENGYEVVGAFTQPDRPKGRGSKVTQSPVKEYALAHGIPVYQPVKIRRDGVDDLRALAPDVVVTAAFGQILSQEVLDIPPMGTVNVHASLLPRHRGASPVHWAILQGDAETGVTTMLSDKGIDTGDTLLTARTPITPEDTAETLLDRLSRIGAALLIETLTRLQAGDCPRAKQDDSASTYDPMLSKEMGELRFTEPLDALLRRVRAMDPWPCAYIALPGGALKVWRATASDEPTDGATPGTVLRADKQRGLIVACEGGAMAIVELQAPGGKRMPARAYLLGHPIAPGINMNEVTL